MDINNRPRSIETGGKIIAQTLGIGWDPSEQRLARASRPPALQGCGWATGTVAEPAIA
jgi:hypothetical protein